MRKFLIALLFSIIAITVYGQSSPVMPTTVTPTDLEQKTLESSLKDLTILQLQFQQTQGQLKTLQDTFQSDNASIDKQIEDVKKAHKWGADVTFNKQTAKFEKAPPPVKPDTVKK